MTLRQLRNSVALLLCLLILLAAVDVAGAGHGWAFAALLPFLFLLAPPRVTLRAVLIRPPRPRELRPYRRQAGLRAPPQ